MKMKKVFVSGCYDIIHANHIRFFEKAKALGDYLIVSFAGDEVLLKYKGRKSALPEIHKKYLLESLAPVDEVVMGQNTEDPIFDFKDEFVRLKPDLLVSTDEDKHAEAKRKFCEENGAKFVQIPVVTDFVDARTTQIRQWIMTPIEINLRVDFAGGWLDVPKLSRKGAHIVNCTISSKVSLQKWQFERGSGLGGSAAYAILSGKNPIITEKELGVGWQDPAVILETGLCVWKSGKTPVLELKVTPDFLNNKMALLWTGLNHESPKYINLKRDYKKIELAGELAYEGVLKKDIKKLCRGVNASYKVQLEEKMKELPSYGEMAKKYCGGGHGGYALYIFDSEKNRKKFLKNENTIAIEPYIREY